MSLPLILIGAVIRAQGLKGALRVVPYLEEMDAYEGLTRVTIRKDDREEECAVLSFRPHGRFLILEIEGVGDREAAESYVGARLYVDRSRLRALEAGEFYKEDILGAAVVTEEGVGLGTVTDFIDTGSNNVLVVRGAGEEHLIPLIRSAVKAVDLESRTITVVAPDKLYEESPESS